MCLVCGDYVFFFKQKTAYEMRISDWISDVCSSDLRSIDGRGLPRSDDWFAGHGDPVPLIGLGADVPASDVLGAVLKKAEANERFTESDIVAMFSADRDDVAAVASLVDRLRPDVVGDTITHVVHRNINYTNLCLNRYGFCAFSKSQIGRASCRARVFQIV